MVDCGCIFFLFISTCINACVENNHFKISLTSFKKNTHTISYLHSTCSHWLQSTSLPKGKKGRHGTTQRQVGARGTCQAESLLQETWRQHHTRAEVPKRVCTQKTLPLSYFSESGLKTAAFHPTVGRTIFRHNLQQPRGWSTLLTAYFWNCRELPLICS